MSKFVRKVENKQVELEFLGPNQIDHVKINKLEAKVFMTELSEAIQQLEREAELGHMQHLQEVMMQGRPGGNNLIAKP